MQYVKNNKANDNDWFKLESNKEGTRSGSRRAEERAAGVWALQDEVGWWMRLLSM